MQDRLGVRPGIVLRLRPDGEGTSRFGMSRAELLRCARVVARAGHERLGVSFHLGNYEVDTRVAAATECLDIGRKLAELGVRLFQLDLGGGYPVKYLESFSADELLAAEHWAGRKMSAGYPYAADPAVDDHAVRVLTEICEVPGHLSLLEAQRTTVVLQPGRALLDQCGLTIFRVLDSKPIGDRRRVVVLDGTSFALSESWFGSDFAPEPVVVGAKPTGDDGEPWSCFLAGRSCLEQDMLRWRAIRIESPISRNDLVIFCNTAGYQMDSNESPFHGLALPKKLAVVEQDAGWVEFLDGEASLSRLVHG